MRQFVFLFLSIFIFSSCTMLVLDGASMQAGESKVLLVVEEGLSKSIAADLEQYREDISLEGGTTELIEFGGNSSKLRSLLIDYNDGSWSAFFIGDIPSVSYEQTILEGYEVFPVDLYYSSPETEWQDGDNNGIFDSHTDIKVTVPVSRLIGTGEEIAGYFQKVHRYRTESPVYDNTAFIFKDDDWSSYRPGKDFGLKNIVDSVTIIEEIPESKKPAYIDEIAGSYRYVYQWIHAVPYSMYIQEDEDYRAVTVLDIGGEPVHSAFFNLFNCKGARFSEDNLGMTYLTETEGGLAVIGSTKVGGIFEPLEFHRSLTAGLSWGKAYKNWYNATGTYDDSWYLGMVILGDPALRVSEEMIGNRNIKGETSITELLPPDEDEKEQVLQNLVRFDRLQTQ